MRSYSIHPAILNVTPEPHRERADDYTCMLQSGKNGKIRMPNVFGLQEVPVTDGIDYK